MKVLVTLCFLLIISLVSFSQDCAGSNWFKPGAILEYKTYYDKKLYGGGSGSMEVTRLTFIVNNVVDSGGKKWAYITKKGKAVKSEMSYEKQITVVCDDGLLGFDATHFGADTVYNSDVPPAFRGKKFSAGVVSKGEKFYPLSAAKTVGNVQQSRSFITQPMMEEYRTAKDYDLVAKKTESEFESKAKITKLEILGEEEISCAAGKFKCSKVAITTEIAANGFKTQATGIYYCNRELGIVKSAGPAYIELISITP